MLSIASLQSGRKLVLEEVPPRRTHVLSCFFALWPLIANHSSVHRAIGDQSSNLEILKKLSGFRTRLASLQGNDKDREGESVLESVWGKKENGEVCKVKRETQGDREKKRPRITVKTLGKRCKTIILNINTKCDLLRLTLNNRNVNEARHQ